MCRGAGYNGRLWVNAFSPAQQEVSGAERLPVETQASKLCTLKVFKLGSRHRNQMLDVWTALRIRLNCLIAILDRAASQLHGSRVCGFVRQLHRQNAHLPAQA